MLNSVFYWLVVWKISTIIDYLKYSMNCVFHLQYISRVRFFVHFYPMETSLPKRQNLYGPISVSPRQHWDDVVTHKPSVLT